MFLEEKGVVAAGRRWLQDNQGPQRTHPHLEHHNDSKRNRQQLRHNI